MHTVFHISPFISFANGSCSTISSLYMQFWLTIRCAYFLTFWLISAWIEHHPLIVFVSILIPLHFTKRQLFYSSFLFYTFYYTLMTRYRWLCLTTVQRSDYEFSQVQIHRHTTDNTRSVVKPVVNSSPLHYKINSSIIFVIHTDRTCKRGDGRIALLMNWII